MKEIDIKVEWQADEDEDEGKEDANQTRMNIFLKKPETKKGGKVQNMRKRPRLDYFKKVKLGVVSEIMKT
jgi:hypothetical protein